jgi:hypothetical protein
VAYSVSTDKNKYHTKYFNILNQRTSLAVHIKDVSNIFDVQAGIAIKEKPLEGSLKNPKKLL